MTKASLVSVITGVVGYLVFAILALAVVPALLPYPTPYDEILTKLVWAKRLVVEKILNLGIIMLVGVFIGFFVSGTDKRLVLAGTLAAFTYQLCGISYLIIRWGFSYYYQNHTVLTTFLYSIVFCIVGAFLGRWINKLRRKAEQGAALNSRHAGVVGGGCISRARGTGTPAAGSSGWRE